MDWKDKTFLVVGTGISGIAAVKLLAQKEANIILFDSNSKLDCDAVRKKFSDDLEMDFILGELPENVMDRVDIAVLSPGVPLDLPFVQKMQERNIPIWGEIELAYLCGKGKLIAITGTNGKTTTTALTGEIMKTYYDSVFVVGNIGLPYTEYALDTTEDSVTVAEVSSFQLETIHKFCPQVSAILNITPDHLNRHHTMECYVETKSFIAKNQTKDQVCVLNYEDAYLQKIAKEIPADVFWFSSEHILERGIWLEGEQIIYCDTERIPICTIHDMKLLGKHNYENVMAAIAIAMHAGVPIDCIRKAVKEFDAVEHRIEYVKEVNGVKYYNDSKGTNPDAAIKAVEAMVRPTVVIGGGYDKQSSYEEWIASFGNKVKCLVLLGETKEAIAKTAREAGFTNIIMTDSLKEAVMESSRQAKEGDAVLLSPACASWDMFKSYEERGKLFKQYVQEL
ncbi:MAG: UDP-N-acetylmuramoyl-L-alanine--D-glutamate ligase [Butyribacter sp.]|nr:UDP-N-acetylmuramoyl-L-alanine--D-glutamate ligase [bacterium]MDY3855425.1 UDP-N-acetylmuramoyl-L-alanine--D-glutamate ligase [Butyribacter sp.]